MANQLVQVISRSHHDRLLEAMWKLRIAGDLCDLTIQVDSQGELKEFEAHQIVLVACSGYFSSLLLPTKETKKVFINNISPTLFSKFLQYVYSGKMEVEKSCLSKVLHMAKQLDCQDLKEACGTKFSDHDYGSTSASKAKTWVKVKRERSKRIVKKAADTRKPIRITLRSVATECERKRVIQARRSSRLEGRRDMDTGEKKKDSTEICQHEDLHEETFKAAQEESSQPLQVGEMESDAVDHILSKENDFTVSGAESPFPFIPDAAEDDVQDFDFLPAKEVEKPNMAQKEGKSASIIKYECEQCTRSFRYEKSYLKHIRVSHGIQSDTTYRCEICQQTFANRSNLTIHERHVHNDERLFICGICSKTFKRKKDVTRHMRQVHEGGISRHICHICGKSLSSRTALKLHSRTHTGDKPYSCSDCGTRFSQSSALKTHKRIHTGEKPFACDMCDARFTQNHMLAYHKRAHTGERPYMCENCGKSFASKEYLKHHARIHSGLKPFKCENCGRAFAQRNSLHQHMKIHTGERPYPCLDCKKQFTQLNALQRHQRIHTGEKPYMCSLCGRTFTDKSTVRRHALTHDKNTPWKNYLIVLPNNLEGHTKKTKTSVKKGKSALKSERHAEENQSLAETEKTEQVTISGEWPGNGTITVVRHATLGNLTVIQTEVSPGTQLQPIITAEGTGVISLEGSAVGIPVTMPYPIPISAALTGTVALCEPATDSDADLASATSSISTVTNTIHNAPAEVTLSEPETEQLVEQTVQPQASDSQLATDQDDRQTIESEAMEISNGE